MTEKINNIKVISTGHYVPSKVMTNADFEKIVETSDEWIVTRTGIKERRMVENETTSDLAAKAAQKAIDKANYDKSKIDVIIVATVTPDVCSPSVANFVQAKLGLNDKPLMAFDVSAGCTGFVYALNTASQLLNSGRYNSALVIGAESLSKKIDYTDRGTCVLFGDGAGAMIIENTSETKPAYFFTASQGDQEEALYVDEHIRMNGKKVYQFALGAMQDALNQSLDNQGLALSDIDVIIPHQANVRIIQSVAKSLELDMDRFYVNIDRYGNTSAASVIIALDEYLEQNPQPNQKVILVAFGAGFTWGSAFLTL